MSRTPMPPALVLGPAVGAGLLAGFLVVFLAVAQPWLGLRLAATADGLVIVTLHPDGPAIHTGLAVGDNLPALQVSDGRTLAPEPEDLIEEPDMLPTFERFNRFLDRQNEFASALRATAEGLALGLPDGTQARLVPASWRPVSDLPAVFWVQLGVGLAGFWIGAWVLCLRFHEASARFLFLAGVGLMTSALAAAVYSTRELALPYPLFRTLSGVNHLGALVFGMGMIGLFLVYPVRLVRMRWTLVPVVVLGAWWLANQMRLLPDPSIGFQLPVLLALLTIGACIALQTRATRADPAARAALRWFGLAVLTGAGAFVVTIILPLLLGFDAAFSQGYAFLFFLPIYGGLALGVVRYRLFDLEDWAFRVLFYMGGVIILLALDAALITLVALERAPAFGVALLVVALAYLPLREALAERLLTRRRRSIGTLFGDITDIALTQSGGARQVRWEALLNAELAPLRIETVAPPDTAPTAPELAGDGAELVFPAIDTLAPVRLFWARGGRGLFTPRDLALAREVTSMLEQACASRRAYETGVAEERTRIAQDMHDNIGIQLMGALHSRSPERKDALIRETLSDLRDILSNANSADLDLAELLADLRASLSDVLSASGIALDWSVTAPPGLILRPRVAYALRSILREAVGNALRHSGAKRVCIRITADDIGVNLIVEDDGKGMPTGASENGTNGLGLTTMRARAAGLGGLVQIGPAQDQPHGTRVSGRVPLAESDQTKAAGEAP